MASAPFIISITVPGDTDTVSQFPGVDRTNLDKLNSWLLIEHNTYGTHSYVTFPQVGSAANGAPSVAPSPAANFSSLYRDTDKYLKVKNGDDSSVQFLQVPPGVVVPYAGDTAPVGWLLTYGQAISRTTYAALFAAISTNHGIGDGSTTFNVPDMRGLVAAGKGNMGGVDGGSLTAANFGSNPLGLGNKGGSEKVVLSVTQIPAHTHSGNISGTFANSDGTSISYSTGGLSTPKVSGSTFNPSFTTDGGTGGGLSHSSTQPSIILNYIIKY